MSETKYSWDEFSVHIVAELDRFARVAERLDDKARALEIELAILKIKIGIWGFAGSACGFILMWVFKETFK